jgi:hypothetical protein
MPDLLTEITQATQRYYRQAEQLQLTATDFLDWVAQLNPAERAALEARGFTTARTELAFLRYCLEARAYSMRGYMMEHLSCAAFALWEGHAQFKGNLPDLEHR